MLKLLEDIKCPRCSKIFVCANCRTDVRNLPRFTRMVHPLMNGSFTVYGTQESINNLSRMITEFQNKDYRNE